MKLSRVLAIIVLLLSSAFVLAEDKGQQEREFAAPVGSVKAALKELGAYTGGRLPTLSGFVTEGLPLDGLDHPYYEFKLETVPKGDGTLVRVKANVSAWETEPGTTQGMYRAVPSNGRLEADLLDRLKAYLTDHLATATTDIALLQQHIASLKQERAAAEARLAQLKRRSEKLESVIARDQKPDLVIPSRGNIPIYAEHTESSSVLFRTQSEDEFEVVERRGTWCRVKLDSAHTGWLRSSQVRQAVAKTPKAEILADAEPQSAFKITREQMFPFAGEWRRLKDKNALFLFVEPSTSASPSSAPKLKLQFAESIFANRLSEMTHSSSSKQFEGIVVIFLDKNGGVAAATINDIKSWRAGALSETSFLSKCSLDPRSAFVTKSVKASSRAHNSRRGTVLADSAETEAIQASVGPR